MKAEWTNVAVTEPLKRNAAARAEHRLGKIFDLKSAQLGTMFRGPHLHFVSTPTRVVGRHT